MAVPDDRIELRENQLFINGQIATYEPLDPAAFAQLPPNVLLRHRFAREKIGSLSTTILLTDSSPPQGSFGPITVQRDHYFLLGDSRDNSSDSRIFGPLGRERIEGRLIMKAY